MSIQDKLNTIKNNLTATGIAITNRGGSWDKQITTLSSAIEGIPSWQQAIDTYTSQTLTEVIINSSAVATYCFANQTSLATATITNAGSIGSSAFRNCTLLNSLTITKSDAVVTLLTADAFRNAGIERGAGHIYVPSNLVDAYKTANNWSTYANYISAIQ